MTIAQADPRLEISSHYSLAENSDLMYRLLCEHPEHLEALQSGLTWSNYIPHDPTGKQLAFLMLQHREAFYGGAAGGGKSDALLMGALQYADVPGYSAIIFRKTFTDLRLPGALIDRSMEWLRDTDAKWDGNSHTWRFPSGAQVAFGNLESELQRFRYQGAEFQFIGFDELTQQNEEDYLYLFSRLRRKQCPKHPPPRVPSRSCKQCFEAAQVSRVPLRMRSASNPGGVGHIWVKNRFKIKRVGDIYRGTNPKRPHIPAFVWDNPFLDQAAYIESLSELDPVTREQLLRGDWGVTFDGRFKKKWCRYYSSHGPESYLTLGPDFTGKVWHRNQLRTFQTVDPAASTREGPGDEQIWRRQPSSTVISTWLLRPDWDLLWWDCRTFRKEIPDTCEEIRRACFDHKPEFIGIEANGLGIGTFQFAQRAGLPVRDLHPRSQDKLVRATDACNRMERGKIYLPQHAPWLEDVEAELFTWTGHPQQPSDRVDTLAYAAIIVSQEAALSETVYDHAETPYAW